MIQTLQLATVLLGNIYTHVIWLMFTFCNVNEFNGPKEANTAALSILMIWS